MIPRLTPHLRFAVALVALAATVFAVCYGATRWAGDPTVVSVIWPANALILAFILRLCRTRWQAALGLFAGFIAMVTANVVVGRPIISTLGFPIGNVIEIALATWFMRGVPMPMARTRDLYQFFLGAVVCGPLASTLVAAPTLYLAFGTEGPELVRSAAMWLASDMMGMAIVAPMALSLGQVQRRGVLKALRVPLVVGVITFLACLAPRFPVLMLAFPMTCLAAINDRDRGAALGVGAVAIALLAATAIGRGPISNLSGVGVNFAIIAQIFLASLVLTVYPLAALVRRQDELAAELDQRRLLAEDASAAKSRMLDQVGVEMRSPLSGVVTVAEMLKSGRLGDLNPRQIELLTRIAESGAEIEALSREMTALARGQKPGLRGASVADLIAEAVEASQFRAHRREVAIEAQDADPDWRADIEPGRLRRILIDALSYAIDGARGGRIRIAAALAPDGGIEIAVDDSGADTLPARMTAFAADSEKPASASGAAFDQQELRRVGGDLSLEPGPLGGARLTIALRRQSDRFPEQVQHRA